MYASANQCSPDISSSDYTTSGEGKLAEQISRQRKWKEIAGLGAGVKVLVEYSPGSATKKGRIGWT